jgi:hypothetical protein
MLACHINQDRINLIEGGRDFFMVVRGAVEEFRPSGFQGDHEFYTGVATRTPSHNIPV